MKLDDLVGRLDQYFRVPEVRGDDWSPGFDDCYPDPYWRDYVESAYPTRWNGLMVRGAPDVEQVVTCVFPSDEIIGGLPPRTLLFSEHPLDFAEVTLFKPLARTAFERMRSDAISFYHVHAPLDMHPEVSPSRLVATGLGLQDLEEYGPIAEGIPGGACIIGESAASLDDLARSLEEVVGAEVPVEVVTRPREQAGRVAVVAGGGAAVSLLEQSLARGCTSYVTGNAARRPQHPFFGPKFDAFRELAVEHKVALVDGTHYGTEKPPQLAMVEWFRRLGVRAEFRPDGPKLDGWGRVVGSTSVSGGIYLVRSDDRLVEMRQSPYEAEEVLQALIAKFPSLLAGDQIDSGSPRRWLLVGREAALPDDEDSAGRWSVDHLFLDQDAVPTLVEVKRSSDTRIRREVVGQMLDYAANGVVYWPLEQLRELHARQCERDNKDPNVVVAEVAGDETDVEQFWQRVGDNLRAGKVRMVFVSDEIPRELRRVVEFLNGQMNPAEVIAIEVKQYVADDGTTTLVPRVIGQTAEVEARKGRRTAGERRQWDEQTLFAELLEKRGPDEARAARDLYDWTLARGWRPTFGSGKVEGSWVPVVEGLGREHYPIALYTYGGIEIQFMHLRLRPPFDNDQTRLELLERANRIAGVSIERDKITKRPRIPLALLAHNEGALEELKRVLEWVEQRASAA